MITNSHTSLIRRAAKAIERLTTVRARAFKLTTGLLTIILALDEEPGLTGAILQKRTGFDKGTMLLLLKTLEERKLITREGSLEHSAAKRNTLTAKGLELAKHSAAIHLGIEKDVRRIVENKRDTLKVRLARVAGLANGVDTTREVR